VLFTASCGVKWYVLRTSAFVRRLHVPAKILIVLRLRTFLSNLFHNLDPLLSLQWIVSLNFPEH